MTGDSVLVLQNAGPLGGPGMPEWGMLPIPKKLLVRGVRDMVRISDGRMSGTAYGTVVLHVAPEAANGGPIAAVAEGDIIVFDIPSRQLNVELSVADIQKRLASWKPPKPRYSSGVMAKYALLVSSSSLGAVTAVPASSSETAQPVLNARTL